MIVLGIETSCDETACAIVQDGRKLLCTVVASQMEEHASYGGVVPELASRRHVELLIPVIRQALSEANLTLQDITAIGVTNRPGLLGALLVGVTSAKALGQALGIPVIPVHHIEAHLYANFITHPEMEFPATALVVSGGHTDLFDVESHGVYRLLGRTRDDAAGEAFDKCARLMGLPYPGGPSIQEAAKSGDPKALRQPDKWCVSNAVGRRQYNRINEGTTARRRTSRSSINLLAAGSRGFSGKGLDVMRALIVAIILI
jgi:N6-L-threonylcarbamoyladenine synthase